MNKPEAISQGNLKELILPELKERGRRYRKSLRVRARPAVPGESVITVTDDGKETEKNADVDEFLVENQTKAKEIYLVPAEHFRTRYEQVSEEDSGWAEYLPTGEIRAIVLDQNLLKLLDQEGTFHIIANWGSAQRVEPGDFLVTPLPECDEIYRIARAEFEQTYSLMGN